MLNQFETKQAVIDFLESQDNLHSHSKGYSPNGVYCLSHGEYSKPDFKPCRYRDGWAIKVIYYYYVGTLNAPKDGRLSENNMILFFGEFENV